VPRVATRLGLADAAIGVHIVDVVNAETVARVLAALDANNQLLTIDDARQAGIDRVVLKRAADGGHIRRARVGKYTSLDAPPRKTAQQGADLGCEAVLSHMGGLSYWGLDGVQESVLEWSVPHRTRSRLGLVHRRRHFDQLEVVHAHGIVVTSVRQTLLDVAGEYDADLVERALECALRKGYVTDREMREYAESLRNARGGPALRAVLRRRPPGARPTGSDPETICLQTCRAAGLAPERQVAVHDALGLVGYGDLGFPPKAFILEVDGDEFHGPAALPYDRDRQGRMEDAGYLVRRVTGTDVLHRPKYVIRRVKSGLMVARYLQRVAPKFARPSPGKRMNRTRNATWVPRVAFLHLGCHRAECDRGGAPLWSPPRSFGPDRSPRFVRTDPPNNPK
jgi:hypothetical protein